VEQKDASPEQLNIKEINTGVLALKTSDLKKWLPQINNDNAQNEYYLTDLIAIAKRNGVKIATRQPGFLEEVEGVNTRLQLSNLERFYQQKQAEKLMASGVTIADPKRIDVRGSLSVGIDSFIDINAVFEGSVKLGKGVSVGPNCVIVDSIIGDYVQIRANSVIEGSEINNHAVIGPFARLRPGARLCERARIGNFVEIKNTEVGADSKINHLSYVGDSKLGVGVNIGAGTITCNYDGANKHKTVMGDNSFIGSNSSLIAPLEIGKNATIGAGSTITKDVPDGQLAVERSAQKSPPHWVRPKKNK
jgi:bifunctional UDP-N-acetylglucosamine pyrophosphorylase/glucosamine-1-phosphate N-acetyltransferase